MLLLAPKKQAAGRQIGRARAVGGCWRQHRIGTSRIVHPQVQT